MGASSLGLGPAGLVAEGIKGIAGIYQMFRGNHILRKTKLPGYDIPDQFNTNVRLATEVKNMGGLSGSEYLKAKTAIDRNEAFGLSSLRDRRSGVAGVGGIIQRSNDASLALNAHDAMLEQSNKRMGTQMLMGANSALGGQMLAKQQWEKFNPYLRKMQEGQSLLGAGMQNTFGVANDVAQFEMMKKMPQPNYNYYSK